MMTANPLTLRQVPQPLRWLLSALSGLSILRAWYDEWLAGDGASAEDFLNFTLAKINVNFEVFNEDQLQDLSVNEDSKPRPLVIVANHPLGGLDGMLLTQLMLRYRKDLKVLTNQLLLNFKEFDDLFIGVDVLNNNKQAQNAKGMRQVAKHLHSGGALLVFPSGTVAALSATRWKVAEAPWQDVVARLAIKYKADCLPVYFQGRNSRWFYLSGLIHPRLRTLMLPRAMVSRRDKHFSAIIGRIVTLQGQLMTPKNAIDYLWFSCEKLAGSITSSKN